MPSLILLVDTTSINLSRLFLGGVCLALLLVIAGCFTKATEVGQPERIGNFTIEKFHETSINTEGTTSDWDYFEISHGRFFPTKIYLTYTNLEDPEFEHITLLPSRSPAWMVEQHGWSALVREKDGKPTIETLWKGGQGEDIQQISATLWYIPDIKKVAGFNFGEVDVYSGGRIFDAVTLSLYPLPNIVGGYGGKLVAVSSDYKAVAKLDSAWQDNGDDGYASHFISTSDAEGLIGSPLTLSKDFLKRSPLPDNLPHAASWQPWFESNFIWKLNDKHRWELAFKSQ